MTAVNLTKVIVPCRLSYAHLWEPDSINGSEPKYSVSCIIDKNDKESIENSLKISRQYLKQFINFPEKGKKYEED